MAEAVGEFVSSLVTPESLSRDRLWDALARTTPEAARWCAAKASRVSRSGLVQAVVDAMPRLLQISWGEVRHRALPTRTNARFMPCLDLFDGAREPLTLTFQVSIDFPAGFAPDATVTRGVIRLELACVAAAPGADVQAFHEVRRDVVLAPPL